MVGLTGEHRPGTDTVDRGVGGQLLDLEVADDATGLEDAAVGELDGLDQDSAVEPGLEVAPLARLVLVDPLDPDAAGAAAIGFADDELLGHVDKPARQVPGVRRTKRRVCEALAGAVGGDEVLQHRQPLAERGLDRPGDHLAARVGHEPLHAGDLTDLLRVAPCT